MSCWRSLTSKSSTYLMNMNAYGQLLKWNSGVPMQILTVHGAREDGRRELMEISIARDIPTAPTLEEQRELYKIDAEKLGQALVGNLPGGTIDQLLVYLLQHQASLYVVSHTKGNNT